MNFDFTEDPEAVRGFRARLRPGASRRGHARARPQSALSLRRGAADEPAGPDGDHDPRRRRRPGRHPDGRRDRHRADRRGLSAQRRRGAVRQFRPDPHLRRICDAGPEGEMAARPVGRPRRHEPRHERARRRLRRDRSGDQRETRWRALRDQRHQAVLHLQPGRQGLSHLCALWAGSRRHRVGDRRARHAGISSRAAVELHERRGMVRAATSRIAASRPRTCCSGRAASSGRSPASMSSASATRRARSPSAAMRSRPRATTCRRASSSAGPCASSRACNGNSPTWRSGSRSAQLLLYRAAANADRGLPSAYETSVAKAACNLAGFEVAHEAVQAMGATGFSRETLVEWCMRRTRGWMIAGGSVEILKNRIAEHVFDRRFDQRGRQAAAAE